MDSFGISQPTWHGERRRRSPRWYTFEDLPNGGLFVGGGFDSRNTPEVLLNCSSNPGMRLRVENFNRMMYPQSGAANYALFDLVHHVSCVMETDVPGGLAPTETGEGILLGSPTTQPWPAADASAFIALEAEHNLATDPWVLHVHPPGGPPVRRTLTGVDAWAVDRSFRLELLFKPGEFVRAYINGVLGFEETSVLPSGNTYSNFGAGIFVRQNAAGSPLVRWWNLYCEAVGYA